MLVMSKSLTLQHQHRLQLIRPHRQSLRQQFSLNTVSLVGYWLCPHVGSRSWAVCGLQIWKHSINLFPVRCRKRQLNHALSVLCVIAGFFWVFFVLCFDCIALFCVISVFYLLVVLVSLSIAVQVINWKDSSPKWPIMCWWGHIKLYAPLTLMYPVLSQWQEWHETGKILLCSSLSSWKSFGWPGWLNGGKYSIGATKMENNISVFFCNTLQY